MSTAPPRARDRDLARFVRPAHIPGVELVSVSYRRRSFPVHTHGEYVVGAVVGGAETLTVGGQRYIVGAGASLFLHPDEPHANATIGDDALQYRVFYLTAASLESTQGGKLPAFAAPVSDAPHLFEALTRAHEALAGESDALEQESAFATLAQTLIDAAPSAARSSLRPSVRTRRVKAFIDENFDEGFGLAALAKVSGMSTVHTLRTFKQEVGVTPLAYRNQVRLARARQLLRAGHAVAETAAAVGFVDQSHLPAVSAGRRRLACPLRTAITYNRAGQRCAKVEAAFAGALMRALFLVLSLIVCATPALAQSPRERIAAILATHNEEPVMNGGVLAVADGRVVYRGVEGFADIVGGRRLRVDDVFQAASMAKPFTSTAVLQLRDRGLLRLDDRVSRYIEGFPFETITIRHLLTHTSGLPDLELFEAMVAADPDHVVSSNDIVPALRAWTQPLPFAPGAQFQYANTNYQLLALIVSRVSGEAFGDYVRDHIFRPARMRHSYVLGTAPFSRTHPPVLNQSYATMYAETQIDVRNIEVNDPRMMRRLHYETFNMGSTLGDQNVFTTLDDLRHFDAALRSGRVLSLATQSEAYAPARLNDGTEYREREVYVAYGVPCSYGMGWETCVHPQFGRLVGHSGYNRGISTMLYRNLDRDQMVAAFDNADMGEFAQKTVSIANALSSAPPVEFSRTRSLTRAFGRVLVRDGAVAARVWFDAHREDTAAWTYTPRGLNQLGYDLLRNGYDALALEPFRLNVELNPEHAGYWDSLGEGLAANGMRDEAIAAYRRSLALNPDNESGRVALQRLERGD